MVFESGGYATIRFSLARLPSRRLAANRIVGEAVLRYGGGIVQIAAIEYHVFFQELPHPGEVGVAEVLPLGDDDQAVRAC
jgi:hypothetical protein